MKKRPVIPKALRDQVLEEFNHRCAICGSSRPQVHHIDNNPENNRINNLLPLCPNHHLRDQHNPTAPFDMAKLGLFRRFKDPTILTPEFEPLFRRFSCLPDAGDREIGDDLKEKALDLIAFIESLSMGNYYAQAISMLIKKKSNWYIGTQGDTAGWERHSKSVDFLYWDQLCKARPQVEALIVELLRYQDWPRVARQEKQSQFLEHEQ